MGAPGLGEFHFLQKTRWRLWNYGSAKANSVRNNLNSIFGERSRQITGFTSEIKDSQLLLIYFWFTCSVTK